MPQRIEVRALSELVPHPRNPRRGNVDAIRASIRANGAYRPIVVREGEDSVCTVLAGWHTAEAMRLEGLMHTWVTIEDVTEEQALGIVLADNRTAEEATYDRETLLGALAEAESQGVLAGTLFSADDLATMRDEVARREHTEHVSTPRTQGSTGGGDPDGEGDGDGDGGQPFDDDDVTAQRASPRTASPGLVDELTASGALQLTSADGERHHRVLLIGACSVAAAMGAALVLADHAPMGEDTAASAEALAETIASAAVPGAPYYVDVPSDRRLVEVMSALTAAGLLVHQTLVVTTEMGMPEHTPGGELYAFTRNAHLAVYGWRRGEEHTWLGARDQASVLASVQPGHQARRDADVLRRRLLNSSRRGSAVLEVLGEATPAPTALLEAADGLDRVHTALVPDVATARRYLAAALQRGFTAQSV